MNNPTNWSTGYNPPRKEFFEKEDYLDPERGYPERDVDWFRSTIFKNFTTLDLAPDISFLLDVGCAHGYFTRILATEFEHTTGVDFTETRIEYAKQYESDTLEFVRADLTSPDFRSQFDREFDVLFTYAVIQHIPLEHKVTAFDNLASVASEDALFVMYDEMIPSGVVDGFVGRYGLDWLEENVKSWNVVGYDLVDELHGGEDPTYRIIMSRVGD